MRRFAYWVVGSLVSTMIACGPSEPKSDPPGDGGTGGQIEGEVESPTSSVGLIGEALDAGEISAPIAAYYELLALHVPSLLPAAYQGEELLYGAPSVTAAMVARANLDTYTLEERAEVEAILADPSDPDWLRFDRLSNFAPTGKSCWELFAVKASEVGARYIGRHVDTKYFRIRALLPVAGVVKRQEELDNRLTQALAARVPGVGGKGEVTLREYFDQSFEYYRDTLKMKDPRTTLDIPQRNKGDDGQPRIPLYVTTCDGGLNTASASPNGFVITSVELGLEDPDLRRVVIPHEIFHVFEYGYTTCDEGPGCWPYEAAATAIEDEIAPGVRRWSGRFASKPIGSRGMLDAMERSFRCPEEPIHSNHSGRCKNRGNSKQDRYGGDYSKFILFKFLMRNHHLTMSDFWEAYANAGADPTKLLDEEYVARFQLALLVDSPEKPAFDPDDREAFRQAMDADPNGVARYTFRAQAFRFKDLGPAFRITPKDSVSRAVLEKGDARSLPIAPGGTHRLLVEVPPEAGGEDPSITNHKLAMIFRSSPSPKVAFNYVALDKGARGPSTTHRSTKDSFGDANASPLDSKYLRTWFTQDHGAVPQYVLATISNFGPDPLTYELGISSPQACAIACTEHYAKRMLELGCPQEWCEGRAKEHRAACQRGHEAENSRRSLTHGFCGTICSPSLGGLDKPYAPEHYQYGREWMDAICSEDRRACSDDPAGFVSVPRWPTMRCDMLIREG